LTTWRCRRCLGLGLAILFGKVGELSTIWRRGSRGCPISNTQRGPRLDGTWSEWSRRSKRRRRALWRWPWRRVNFAFRTAVLEAAATAADRTHAIIIAETRKHVVIVAVHELNQVLVRYFSERIRIVRIFPEELKELVHLRLGEPCTNATQSKGDVVHAQHPGTVAVNGLKRFSRVLDSVSVLSDPAGNDSAQSVKDILIIRFAS
jgi:hypothetical protein